MISGKILQGNFKFNDILINPLTLQRRIPFFSKHPSDLMELFQTLESCPPYLMPLGCVDDGLPQNEQDGRYYLAVHLSQHPDTAVRKALVQPVKHFVPQLLPDLLGDQDEEVQLKAAKALWEMTPTDTTYFLQALRHLRDEVHRRDLKKRANLQSKTVQTLNIVRDARPDREADYIKFFTFVWCYEDADLACLCQQLHDLYRQHHSFLGDSKNASNEICRQINKIGQTATQLTYEAMWLTLGSVATEELTIIWAEISHQHQAEIQ